jgi:hypothetical protein
LRAALFAPRSNPGSALWILDCFGAKEAPRNDGLKHLFLRLSLAAVSLEVGLAAPAPASRTKAADLARELS